MLCFCAWRVAAARAVSSAPLSGVKMPPGISVACSVGRKEQFEKVACVLLGLGR